MIAQLPGMVAGRASRWNSLPLILAMYSFYYFILVKGVISPIQSRAPMETGVNQIVAGHQSVEYSWE